MSYNISSFKIKRLENLVIPLSALYDNVEKNWKPEQPKIVDASTMEVEIYGGCGQTIKGILKDDSIHVTKLDLSGEGSGSYMHYIIKDALLQSTGELDAILIWEGGDSVSRLTVKDGLYKDESMDL